MKKSMSRPRSIPGIKHNEKSIPAVRHYLYYANEKDDNMVTELTSAIVKEYGLNAGANVVGIATSKDFSLAPDGYKPTDVLPECLSVIVLGATFWVYRLINR